MQEYKRKNHSLEKQNVALSSEIKGASTLPGTFQNEFRKLRVDMKYTLGLQSRPQSDFQVSPRLEKETIDLLRDEIKNYQVEIRHY